MSDLTDQLARRVDALELSVRTSMSLDKAGIATVGELVQLSAAELAKQFQFSKVSVQELEDLLADMSLSLRR